MGFYSKKEENVSRRRAREKREREEFLVSIKEYKVVSLYKLLGCLSMKDQHVFFCRPIAILFDSKVLLLKKIENLLRKVQLCFYSDPSEILVGHEVAFLSSSYRVN